MSNALLCLVPYQPTINAHVLCDALRTLPLPRHKRRFRARFEIHWGVASKPRWNFDRRLADQHRHRIEIARIRFQSEPLSF